MAGASQESCCPHCGGPLQAFSLPDGTAYDEIYHLACFNNECPYFREGWAWMWEQYSVKASYRYRINPQTMVAEPLPVWSETAVRDRIMDLNQEDKNQG